MKFSRGRLATVDLNGKMTSHIFWKRTGTVNAAGILIQIM